MKELIIFNPSIEDGGVEKNLYIIGNFLSKKGLKISLISTDIDKKKKFNKNINFINPGFMDYSKSGRYVKYLSCLLVLIYKILINRNIVVLAFQANIYAILIAKILAVVVPLLIAVAYFTLAERKIMGSIQRRRGPNVVGYLGLLQPLADGLKLFLKESIVPASAHKGIFILSPILTFLLALSL